MKRLKMFILVLASLATVGCAEKNITKDVESYTEPQETSWKLVWNDEFDKDGLPDSSKWSFEVQKPGWVNQELQNYTDKRLENCRIENGKLIIEARKDNYQGMEYSSSRIKTEGKAEWKYGKVEVRAKLPKGKGTWPAIWMMPTNNIHGGWPNSGEIDIMENVGYEPGVIHTSLHSRDNNFMNGKMRTASMTIPNVEDDFHNYILEWTETTIKVYVDKTLIGNWTKPTNADWGTWPWDDKYHLILNLAVGGSWGGQQGVDANIWPQKMEVDYVRVYQK